MSAVTTPIKFEIPDGCRSFAPFPRLPPETRLQIWEAYLTNAGVNYVKLQNLDPGWRWGVPTARALVPGGGYLSSHTQDVNTVVRNEARTQRVWHAKLVTRSRDLRADTSNYAQLYAQLLILGWTCPESARMACSLLKRPGVFKIGSGHIITLDNSPDLVYLEYLPAEFYDTNCNLDFKLNCPGLDTIRRAAVRFCHSWQPNRTSKICRSCGKPHGRIAAGHYPAHLYQFLARYMPKLEELFLIDYFIVPNIQDGEADFMSLEGEEEACKKARLDLRPPQVFRAKNRVFHEIDADGASDAKWKIDPNTRHVRAWLQNSFVRYAKASNMSRHKAPERVRFGILACEWKVPVPVIFPVPNILKKSRTKTKGGFKRPTLSDSLRPTKSVSGGRRHVQRLPGISSNRMRGSESTLLKARRPTTEGANGPLAMELLRRTTKGREWPHMAEFGTNDLSFFKFKF